MITVLVSVPLLMMVMPSIQNTLGSAFMVYSFFYNSLKLNPDSSTTDNGLEYYARLSATNNSTGSIEYSSKNWDTSSVYDIYSLVENSAYK